VHAAGFDTTWWRRLRGQAFHRKFVGRGKKSVSANIGASPVSPVCCVETQLMRGIRRCCILTSTPSPTWLGRWTDLAFFQVGLALVTSRGKSAHSQATPRCDGTGTCGICGGAASQPSRCYRVFPLGPMCARHKALPAVMYEIHTYMHPYLTCCYCMYGASPEPACVTV
jgi:hypothetical protein